MRLDSMNENTGSGLYARGLCIMFACKSVLSKL